MLILAESCLDTPNRIGSKVVVCNLFGLAKQISVQGLCGHIIFSRFVLQGNGRNKPCWKGCNSMLCSALWLPIMRCSVGEMREWRLHENKGERDDIARSSCGRAG